MSTRSALTYCEKKSAKGFFTTAFKKGTNPLLPAGNRSITKAVLGLWQVKGEWKIDVGIFTELLVLVCLAHQLNSIYLSDILPDKRWREVGKYVLATLKKGRDPFSHRPIAGWPANSRTRQTYAHTFLLYTLEMWNSLSSMLCFSPGVWHKFFKVWMTEYTTDIDYLLLVGIQDLLNL